MIQWEEVELKDATHVEIGGEVHEIKERDGIVERNVNFGWIDILIEENKWAQIPQAAFSILGIRCLRRFKPLPIQFEAMFVSYDGNWRFLYTLDDAFAYQNCKTAKFRCVQILEDEE
jgi:hypothetical protein